jgi:hypothetical protein
MRFHLVCFVLLILFASSIPVLPTGQTYRQTTGQKKADQDNTASTKPCPQSLSPYDIALFIADNPDADLRDLWGQLGIKSLNFGDSSVSVEQHGQTDRFLTNCKVCDVETYAYELDGEPGREILLKVSFFLEQSCRYLLFKQLKNRGGKSEWKLLGHIDHGFGKYRMPEHSIVNEGGKQWLTVKVQEGSGSGFALYHDRLFDVSGKRLTEILRFPSEGHLSTCCHYPTRKFEARIIKCETVNNVTTVELEFSISYSSYLDSDDFELWKKKQKAVYKTDPKSGKLVLDTTQSDISEEEIDAIYNGEGLSDEELIKYNSEELQKIAAGQESRHKQWLRLFLNQGEQSPGKESLRQLIKQ